MFVFDQPMLFGKWKSHSILEVAQKDPKYVLWARTHIKGKYGQLLFNALQMTVSELGMTISDYVNSR